MNNIDISISNEKIGELFFQSDKQQYGFNYVSNKHPISLIMPYKSSSYIWKQKLHPVFDMYMPEGYLFELFKNYLSKEYGYIDDFLIFSYLCTNIQSRLKFKSKLGSKSFKNIDMKFILENDTQDTFVNLVKTFMSKNAISGIQPKTLAIIDNKDSFGCKEYIIKTWGDEYAELSLNEYFCLKAVEYAGVEIPHILLSKNNKFLIVQRFDYDQKSGLFLGFEEILGLLGKNKEEKYSGSYEQVAKVIYSVVTNKHRDMTSFYKTIVMNYLLRNGDAHLKNFGIVYDNDFKNIRYSPAYDIVNTVVYFYKDRPALSMFGKKVWFGKKELVKFGVNYCYLSKDEADKHYETCFKSLEQSIKNLKEYLKSNNNFRIIGLKIVDSWSESLDKKTKKELADEVTRNWA